jgi:hypothetical protein
VTNEEFFSKISDFPHDWNGDGANKPKDFSIKNARKFIELIKEASLSEPKAMLENEGTVCLYWYYPDKSYIDISFDERNTFSVYKRKNIKEQTYKSGIKLKSINKENIAEMIKF